METLESIRAKFAKPAPKAVAELPPPLDAVQPDGTIVEGRPWQVYVVNPRRGEPKFYFSYMTREEAESERVRLNGNAAAKAQEESNRRGIHVEPFQYFVVAKPKKAVK